MHPDLLVKALLAIEPETTITFSEFQSASGILSRSVARNVIKFLKANDIGSFSKSTIKFSRSDRIYAALAALQLSCDIEQISRYLSWKDFEKFSSEVLGSFGYRTRTNVRLSNPRIEIDVVGTSEDGFTLAVDCKHWKRSNLSSISIFTQKQAARSEQLIMHDLTLSAVVPLLLTLHAESVYFVDKVPVVPIHRFRSFILDVKGFLHDIHVATPTKS
jgi:hypothetical protein